MKISILTRSILHFEIVKVFFFSLNLFSIGGFRKDSVYLYSINGFDFFEE